MKRFIAPLSRVLVVTIVVVAASALFLSGGRRNPPGFYADEASISYNALRIGREGMDEHGERFPLFFRSFGEYKNPVHIYLLAGVFKVATPSRLVARNVSRAAGVATGVVLAALAYSISRKPLVAVLTFAITACTPAIFEIAQLVFEVALYPLAIALFLLVTRRASMRDRWTVALVIALVASLVLVTYTYTVGRLLGPLFAAGLAFLWQRGRRRALVITWSLYVLVGIAPLVHFHRTHGNALTGRLGEVGYVHLLRQDPMRFAREFERHFLLNLAPLASTLYGDPNARHHVKESGGSLLLANALLAIAGAADIIRNRRVDRWWLFVLYGTVMSLVAASLTNDEQHSLLLSSYTVFILVLGIAALDRVAAADSSLALRAIVGIALVVGLLQWVYFFSRFRRDGPKRSDEFDGEVRPVIEAALDRPERPVYLDAGPHYVHAYWYGALRGIPQSSFVRGNGEGVRGALVIRFLSAEACDGCSVIAQSRGITALIRP